MWALWDHRDGWGGWTIKQLSVTPRSFSSLTTVHLFLVMLPQVSPILFFFFAHSAIGTLWRNWYEVLATLPCSWVLGADIFDRIYLTFMKLQCLHPLDFGGSSKSPYGSVYFFTNGVRRWGSPPKWMIFSLCLSGTQMWSASCFFATSKSLTAMTEAKEVDEGMAAGRRGVAMLIDWLSLWG